MPEAAMDEHQNAVTGEYHVWLATNGPVVQPVPQSQLVKSTSYDHLRPGILGADPAHHEPPLLWSQYICGSVPRNGTVKNVRFHQSDSVAVSACGSSTVSMLGIVG